MLEKKYLKPPFHLKNGNIAGLNMVFVSGIYHSDSIFLYIIFQVIINYWLYSLCCTIYPFSLFNYIYLLLAVLLGL